MFIIIFFYIYKYIILFYNYVLYIIINYQLFIIFYYYLSSLTTYYIPNTTYDRLPLLTTTYHFLPYHYLKVEQKVHKRDFLCQDPQVYHNYIKYFCLKWQKKILAKKLANIYI